MSAKRIMIGGAIGHHPIGGSGNAWAFLQYILGFRALGFDTFYVEHLEAKSCWDDQWNVVPFVDSVNARYVAALAQRFGLEGTVALLDEESSAYVGLSHADVQRLARDADVFINMSGRFHVREVLAAARRRMYLDMDPGFTQIWQEQYDVDMNLRGHDVYVTVGPFLGTDKSPLPTGGVQWKHTLPPVVIEEWQTDVAAGSTYTTVADWRGYGAVEWQGVWYGQKAQEFARLIDVPSRVNVPMEICLAIHPDEADRAMLTEHGWRLSEPRARAATPDAYREYIWQSRGEFSAAKHGYVAGRTGWFSDRSACYLAAGRPVILQDTGFSQYLPAGRGLLAFDDPDRAIDAIRMVEADYAAHAAAARAIAREHFDARRVLPHLLELAGL
ncbi:MAG TPA: hypothetical protein VMW17_02785 [Candidatus Binatia bacterium]|nr:hypothetical protein [Candidatus Binatia bacterium]